MKKHRTYASFYEWPEKQVKELGVARELVESLAAHGIEYRDLRMHEPDPPDCVCVDSNGRPVALELVELVSQQAIEANQRGANVYRWWEPEEIRSEVSALLSRKDTKVFSGGPYVDVAVVIYTDEPALTADEARGDLLGVTFGPFNQLTRAFLMFSYMPGKGHEVLQLSVATNDKASR